MGVLTTIVYQSFIPVIRYVMCFPYTFGFTRLFL